MPHFGNVNERILDCSHAGTDADSVDSAFHGGDTLFQYSIGGIADPGIDVALDFEIKQSRAVFRAVKLESDGLVDRHGHGLCGGVAVIPRVNCNGLKLHASAFPHRFEPVHFTVVATLRTPIDDGLCAIALAMVSVSRRAAKPAPKAKRITGPKLAAAASPAK